MHRIDFVAFLGFIHIRIHCIEFSTGLQDDTL